jgi:TPP-dependent trihydroxycyclohexane-1,2-dione (THcHDO) dehydratase
MVTSVYVHEVYVDFATSILTFDTHRGASSFLFMSVEELKSKKLSDALSVVSDLEKALTDLSKCLADNRCKQQAKQIQELVKSNKPEESKEIQNKIKQAMMTGTQAEIEQKLKDIHHQAVIQLIQQVETILSSIKAKKKEPATAAMA